MHSPLRYEKLNKHRSARRRLIALAIAGCAASSATAQAPPSNSALPLKSAVRVAKVQPEAVEPAQPQPAAPVPEHASWQHASWQELGPQSASPKSARLLNPAQHASSQAALPGQSGQPLELRGAASTTAGVPLPSVPAPVVDVPTPQQRAGHVAPESVLRTAPEGNSDMLGLPGTNAAEGLQGPVQAAAPDNAAGNMTLAALESMALSANPSLGRASAEVAAARGAAVQAGLPFNPTVGYEGQQIGSNGLAEQHGVLVSQEFLRREKRTLSREVACREVEMAQYRYAVQRSRVLTDVRIAFYRAVRAQRQIDMSSALLRISEQALRAAEALAQAQEIARTDVLQAQIEVDAARASLDNARNQHQSAWNQLAAVTGQSQLQVVPLDGDLFAPSQDLEFEAVLAWLRGQSPEIAVAVANVERARLNWQRQRVEPRPNLSVQGLYNFVDNGIDGDPDAAVAVSVPVPLYNRNQGAIQQARYEIVVAERSLAQLELALQQRLAPVYERYRNAKTLVEQYGQRILPAAAEVLELTQKTFEVGEIGFTNLLIAQRSYRQQQLLYLDAAEALRISEAEIDGLLLSGSLTEPPR